MRILHLGKFYHPDRGGMETVLRVMVEGLTRRGAEVSVLVAGSGMDRAVDDATGGCRLVRAWTPWTINSQPVAPTLGGLLRRELAAWRPDVVTLHLPHPLAAAAWLAFGPGRHAGPALTVWHHADITRQRWGRIVAAPVQAVCLARSAGIAVSSEAQRLGSRELAKVRDRVSVVPFGIAPEPWQAQPAGGGGAFLFVGRLVPYKGLDVLLRALASAPGARLDVVGTGPRERAWRRLAETLGVGDRVRWLGGIGDRDLAGLMAAARALVLPSLDVSETFGLVQLEAMAAGVPVIASELPTGVSDVADPASHVLVPPGDAAALGRALVLLGQDADLARRMGAAGRARQAEHFHSDAMADRLVAWYERALARRG